jgi:hypothetical protein
MTTMSEEILIPREDLPAAAKALAKYDDNPGLLHKLATDVAGACRDIVMATAMEIGYGDQKRQYVRVEGWQAIANAFGCVASARDVQKVLDEDGAMLGFKAIGEVRRSRDGMVLATAEGFVGADEPLWFGGEKEYWDQKSRKNVKKKLEARPEYAVRAMCQTRAISRACRSAFAFVVVMISTDLDTTPAEEVDEGETHSVAATVVPAEEKSTEPKAAKRWQEVECTYGTKNGPLRGKLLGELSDSQLRFVHDKFAQEKTIQAKDREMVAGLAAWESEQG